MAERVVRLGSARCEGIRIGTVHRPPRGVLKSEFASQNWYDVWFPILAPSLEAMKFAQTSKTARQWAAFTKKYRAEMAIPESRHSIALLAALSHHTNFSVGCYCEDELRCHRSAPRTLFMENRAKIE
ncbi:MAG: DUF488 family protein [Acidobacteria bacterium]|nr:DUF488 family protein [Acidobacteriota bacterium]